EQVFHSDVHILVNSAKIANPMKPKPTIANTSVEDFDRILVSILEVAFICRGSEQVEKWRWWARIVRDIH
ncbi:hypothetical protein SLA2020_370540, partial [Shorea laevis]